MSGIVAPVGRNNLSALTLTGNSSSSGTSVSELILDIPQLPIISPPSGSSQTTAGIIQNLLDDPNEQNRIAFFNRAVALFEDAFINGQNLEIWEEFKQAVEITPLSQSHFVGALFVLAGSRMESSDREMLFNYLKSYSDPQGSGATLSSEIATRFLECLRLDALSYNSWQGWGYESTHSLFISFFKVLFGNGDYIDLASKLMNADVDGTPAYQFLLTQVLSSEAQAYFVPCDTQEAEDHLYVELFLKWQFAQREWQNAPIGSELKILAYQRLSDYETIAMARGWYLNFWFQDLNLSIPGLNEDEYHDLFKAEFYAQPVNYQFYIDTLKNFVDQFKAAGQNSERREALSQAIHLLVGLAPHYNVSYAEVNQILRPIMSLATGNISDLQALQNLSHDKVVAPEGIPQEIENILVQTGYWDLVSRNLYQIRFSREIDEGQGSFIMDSSGYAIPCLHMVTIDYIDIYGEMVSPWEIAATLIHEAAHVAWNDMVAEEAPNRGGEDFEKFFLSSLPNERQAVLVEMEFLKGYLDGYQAELDPQNINRINSFLNVNLVMVREANRVLGYDLEDLNADNFTLPPPAFLLERGLESASDLDLQTYIYYQAVQSVNSEEAIDLLMDSAPCIFNGPICNPSQGERNTIEYFLKEVLKGKAYFDITYVSNEISITLVYPYTGIRRPLSASEAQTLCYVLQGNFGYDVLFSSENSYNIDNVIHLEFRSLDLLLYLRYSFFTKL
jgi:hypothetical protein